MNLRSNPTRSSWTVSVPAPASSTASRTRIDQSIPAQGHAHDDSSRGASRERTGTRTAPRRRHDLIRYPPGRLAPDRSHAAGHARPSRRRRRSPRGRRPARHRCTRHRAFAGRPARVHEHPQRRAAPGPEDLSRDHRHRPGNRPTRPGGSTSTARTRRRNWRNARACSPGWRAARTWRPCRKPHPGTPARFAACTAAR